MKLIKRKNNNILISVISVMLLLGFLWRYTATDSSNQFIKPSQTRQSPDFFITNATGLRFNKEGQLSSRVKTPSVKHLPIDNITELVSPTIDWFKDRQLIWQISANSGIVSNDEKRVELSGQVVANNQPHQQLINTEQLTFFPEQKRLENSVLVSITNPQGVTTATGFKADLNKEHLLLKKNVRGQYHASP